MNLTQGRTRYSVKTLLDSGWSFVIYIASDNTKGGLCARVYEDFFPRMTGKQKHVINYLMHFKWILICQQMDTNESQKETWSWRSFVKISFPWRSAKTTTLKNIFRCKYMESP